MKKPYLPCFIIPLFSLFFSVYLLPAQTPFQDAHPGLEAHASWTGRTTGHIIDLYCYNSTGEDLETEIGPLAIPSDGEFQGYVVNDVYPVTVPAFGYVVVEMEGYCIDHTRPAKPAGSIGFPREGWVVVDFPAAVPGPGDNLISEGYESYSVTEEIEMILTYPGTTNAFTYRIDIDEYITTTGPVLVEVVNRIEEAYDEWLEREEVSTATVREVMEETEMRSTIVQYVFWYYTSILRGETLTEEAFTEMIVEETEVVVNTSSEYFTEATVTAVREEARSVWEVVTLIGPEAKIMRDSRGEEENWGVHFQRWVQEELADADPTQPDCGLRLAVLADTLDVIRDYLGSQFIRRIQNGIAVKLGDFCKFQLGSMKNISHLDAWGDLEALSRSKAFGFLEPGTQQVVREELGKKVNAWFMQEINTLGAQDEKGWLGLGMLAEGEHVAAYLEPSTENEMQDKIKVAMGEKLAAFLHGQLDELDPADTSTIRKWSYSEVLVHSDWFTEYLSESVQNEIIRKLGEKFTAFLITQADQLNPADTSMLQEWMKIEVLVHSDWFSTYVSKADQETIIRKLKEKFTSFMKTQSEKLNPADEGMLKEWIKLEKLTHSEWFTTYVSEADREEIIRILKKKFTEFVKKRLDELDPKDPDFLKKWQKLHNLRISEWFDTYLEDAKKAEGEMSDQYRRWNRSMDQPVEYSQINWQEVEWTSERIKTFLGGPIPGTTDREGLKPWTWAVITGVPVAGGIVYAVFFSTPPPEANPDALTISCPGEGIINVLANDEGKEIRIVAIEQPTGATVTDQGFGNLLVTLDLVAPVSQLIFTYTIEDRRGRESTAQVLVQVAFPAIDAMDDLYEVFAGSPLAANVLANDVGEGLLVTGHTPPAGGTFSISPNGSFTYIQEAGVCEPATFTYTVTDACQQSSGATATIQVTDNKAPEITCPADTTISCELEPNPSLTGMATATDNCTFSPTITYVDEYSGVPCNQLLTRTWTATDEAGLTASCDQLIHIVDETAPVIVCPVDITVQCGQEMDLSLTGSPTAFDPCGGLVTLLFTDDLSGVSGCEGVIVRTWTAVDPCGNASFCMQLITLTPGDCPFEPLVVIQPSTCGLPDGEIILDVNPPGEYTFQWSNGITGPVATNLLPGSYLVTISDPVGFCTEIVNIFLPEGPPEFILNANIIPDICLEPGNIILQLDQNNSGIFEIFVNGPNSFLLPPVPPGEVVIGNFGNLPPGSYTLVITDPSAPPGCFQEIVVEIPYIPPYTLEVVSVILPSAPAASDGEITLTVNGNPLFPLDVLVNGVFVGQANSAFFTLTGIPVGVYDIMIVAAGGSGCESNTVTVIMESPPEFAGMSGKWEAQPLLADMPALSVPDNWGQSPAAQVPEHPELEPGSYQPGWVMPPIGMGLSYWYSDHLQFRWQMSYGRGKAVGSWLDPVSGSVYRFETAFRGLSNEGDMRVYGSPGRATPFLGLGITWHRLSYLSSYLEGIPVVSPEAENQFSASLSAGMRVQLGQRLSLELEGRMRTPVWLGDVPFFELRPGVSFQFGQ